MQGSVWNYIAHCLFVWNFFGLEVVRVSRMTRQSKINAGLKSQLFRICERKISVWIIKWTTLLGIICKINFTPTVASRYQVHADTHLFAALLCYFRCHWCRNLAVVNCILHWIVLTPSTLYTRNSGCITLLWLHNNHKMSIATTKTG